MGWHIAAMRSKKSSAKAEVGPGRGLMKIMRDEGCGRGALRRWMPIGIAAKGRKFLSRTECMGICKSWLWTLIKLKC